MNKASPRRSSDPKAQVHEAQALSALRNLLARRPPPAAKGQSLDVPVSADDRELSTAALLTVLDHLQRLTPEPGIALVDRVHEAIATDHGQISDSGIVAPSLGERDADVLEVTSMLLEVIGEDPNVADWARPQIRRLQVPLLKVALLDPEFFPNRTHPARRFLNLLARVAPDADAQRRQTIEQIVDQVVAEFGDRVELFARLLGQHGAELGHDAAGERALAATTAEYRAREQRVEAEREVDGLLDQALTGKAVPRSVVALLRGPWRRALVMARMDNDEAAWNRRRELVRELLWSVGEDAHEAGRHAVAAAIPTLLSALREGLSAAGCTDERAASLLEALEPLHLAVLRGQAQPDTEAPAVSETNEGGPLDDLIAAMEAQMASLDELASIFEEDEKAAAATEPEAEEPPADPGPQDPVWLERARALGEGTWLEFATDKGPLRGRLGWRSELLDEVLFVDRRFKPVAELGLTALGRMMESGEARVVEDVPLVDRAIDRLVTRLSHRVETGKG